MKAVAIDTETHLFKAGEFAPKCVSVALHGAKRSELLLASEGAPLVESLLDLGYTTIFANPGFDIATLCLERESLFDKFVYTLREGRVWCVQLAQKLIDIEVGCRKHSKYSLGALTERFFGVELDKSEDSWRLRYAELDGIPIDEWPEEARTYAELDAKYTWDIYLNQKGAVNEEQLAERVRFDVALYWQSREGMGVAEEPVRDLEKRTLKAIAELEPEFIENGLLKDRNPDSHKINLFTGEVSKPDWGNNVKALKERVCTSYGVLLEEEEWVDPDDVPKTEKGSIRIDGAALLETDDDVLHRFAEYAQHVALRNKDLVFLRKGLKSGRIHTRFDSLLDTGRTSSRDPNLQNLTRTPGVRECFVPSNGWKFLDVDYASAELHTLAQTCLTLFGESKLAEALNAGLDPHIMMSQRLVGIADYEEMKAHPELKHYRQIAKAPNFALPGGMGATGLTKYAKGMGINLEEVGFPAEVLIEAWREQWPEMRLYFNWVRKHIPLITLPCGSHRVRHTEFFTEAANYCFQGLAADGAGLAAWAIFDACYVEQDSPLYGCKPVMFVHDQFIVEAPEERAEEALVALCNVMRDSFNLVVPDVPCSVEGEIKSKWTK